MKQALISPNESVLSYGGVLLGERVAETAVTPFEVAPPMFWVACADSVVADQWYYDPATSQIIQIPEAPFITASFNPSPTLVNLNTTLTWSVTSATNVKLSSYGDQLFPASGSMDYTYVNAGTYNETITAIDPNGNVSRSVSIKVVSTQAELTSSGTLPFTVA
jgi:hypothetical protein